MNGPAFGGWVTRAPDAAMAAYAKSDLDFVVIDCQHSAIDEPAAAAALAGAPEDLETLVRVSQNNEALIGRVLDGMGMPPVLTPRRILDAARRPRWAYGFARHRRIGLRNLIDRGGTAAGLESARRHAGQVELARFDWDDLAWVRERWRGPLYVKGLLDPDDASRAVALGADGVVVSNHGGRQLDGALAALDALPAVVAAVGGRARVLMDGGVRRGSDVVKALCLGADACLVGRPVVYGLGAAGAQGVHGVLRILREEIERTLALMGCGTVGGLDRSWLVRSDDAAA